MYPSKLVDAVRDLARAKEVHEVAFLDFYQSLKPLSKSEFWKIMEVFKKEVESFCFGLGRTNGVEEAARELFRKALCKQTWFSVEDACRFVLAYECAERLLRKKLGKFSEFSNDSADDFFDSLPVVSKELMAMEEASSADLECFLNRLDSKWRQFVLGENYVCMNLKDAASEYVYVEALEQK